MDEARIVLVATNMIIDVRNILLIIIFTVATSIASQRIFFVKTRAAGESRSSQRLV